MIQRPSSCARISGAAHFGPYLKLGAVLAEEMISDEPYRLAEQSWSEHQRPAKPCFVQNIYYAFGPDAEDGTHKRLEERGLIGVISKEGKPAPLGATKQWVVEIV